MTSEEDLSELEVDEENPDTANLSIRNLTKSKRSTSIDSRTDLIHLDVPVEESDDLYLEAPESPISGETISFQKDEFGIQEVL